MKDWAIENGATHYTHWFQPLTGSTAEKHDSMIVPDGHGGMLFEFSGKCSCRASPMLRRSPLAAFATFEARLAIPRGIRHLPAFTRSDSGVVTLCIPTAFVSERRAARQEDPAHPLDRCAQRAGDAHPQVFGTDKVSAA